MEIRALDRPITSGKACAKAGPTKVKGVGKGLAEKMDELVRLETKHKEADAFKVSFFLFTYGQLV